MVPLNSLVAYKNRPALVTETGDKLGIALRGGEKFRVREKDIELIFPGPCLSGDLPAEDDGEIPGEAGSAWELLQDAAPVSIGELAELVYGTYTAKTAWAAYGLLREGLYFFGTAGAIRARGAAELAEEERKRAGRRQELLEREAFLNRLKTGSLLPGDRRFFQDAEALAWGKTDKSRLLRELGKAETPLEAHRLLLAAGIWTPRINPHPARFGLSPASAKTAVPPPPEEERRDLTHLTALAIDNAWSRDPDDALSLEGDTLWIHVADPAAAVFPDSPADLEARARGSTCYLPEGPVSMMAEEALPRYALGLSEISPALSFRIVLNGDGSIAETEAFRSRIRVRRMNYGEADACVSAGNTGAAEAVALEGLFRIAERNLARRLAAGAVSIDLPETHLSVSPEQVSIEPVAAYRSSEMVRECMLLAGEGMAGWAIKNRVPFPYVTQETGDLPASPLPGLAGSYQIRRCMRPRVLSAKPGNHWGLGLGAYTQVTSPLRRYTDLLAHQQIRAFLKGESPLTEEEVFFRLAAGEAAAAAAVQAERASRAHWTAVYLSDKIGSHWEGLIVEKKGPRGLIIIPALALEIQTGIKQNRELNETVSLTLSSVRIPEAETVFVCE
jgi:exoribonuclease-2